MALNKFNTKTLKLIALILKSIKMIYVFYRSFPYNTHDEVMLLFINIYASVGKILMNDPCYFF